MLLQSQEIKELTHPSKNLLFLKKSLMPLNKILTHKWRVNTLKRSLIQLPGSIPMTDGTLESHMYLFGVKVCDKKYKTFIFIQKLLDIYFCLLIPSPEGGMDEI